MRREILRRLKELGGNIDKAKGLSLQEDLLAVTFDTVLYPRPVDTPWASAEETEPIYGIGEFIDEIKGLLDVDEEAFYARIVEKYFCLTETGYGQTFWQGHMFTPYKEGTSDFDEWSDWFNEDDVLIAVRKHTGEPKPEFIQLFYSYGFPDNYYICLSDPNPDNPTVYGTDHEVFFTDITNEGSMVDFLKQFMTKSELLEIIKKALSAPR